MKKTKKKSTAKSPTSSANMNWMDKIRAAGDRALAATAKELDARRAQGKASEQAQNQHAPSAAPDKAPQETSEHDEINEQAEETDGAVRCPFCQSTNACDHLLACLDTSYGVEGGILYDNLEQVLGLIKKAFLDASRKKIKKPSFFSSPDLKALWENSSYDPNDEDYPISIDYYARFVSERLCNAGAISLKQEVAQGNGTYEYYNLYTKEPEKVLEEYDKTLRRDLGIAVKRAEEEKQK